LAEGFRDIVVAVGSHTPEIHAFLEGRGQELLATAGSTLVELTEQTPLGTMGAARLAIGNVDNLLVVNVDNLTTLSLRAFVEHHHDENAALTIACHSEPFQIPFGQLIIKDGDVLEYREKPIFGIPISSGVYAISRTAAHLIVPDCRYDITDLFWAVRKRQLKISAFEHDCPWIDINDEKTLNKAEAMFTRWDELA
jgi:mannose-1-phosphate guanylyltransferase/phosphomannomutase